MTTPVVAPVAPAATGAAQTPAATQTPATDANGAQKPAAAAQKPAETKAEAKQRLKIKAKVGGKEEELDLGEDDVVRYVQKAKHYEAQQAARDKRDADFDARLRRLTEDPDAFFEESGIDIETMLAERGKRAEQMKTLTPEQQEVMKLRQELAKRDQFEQKRAATEKQQAEVREHQALVQRNVGRIGKALEMSGMPRSGEMVKLYAEVQELAEYAGEPELSPEQMVSAGDKLMLQRLGNTIKVATTNEAWRTRNAEQLAQLGKTVLPNLKGEALLGYLGPEIVKAVTAAAWEKLRGTTTPIIQEPPRPATDKPANGSERQLSQWDVLDRLGG